MEKIEIDKNVNDLTPNEFKNLLDVDYRLTKTESTRNGSMVFPGDSVRGTLSVVEVGKTGLPGVKICGNSFKDYLRTSPIVAIINSTDTTITFCTEGGTYFLEKVETLIN